MLVTNLVTQIQPLDKIQGGSVLFEIINGNLTKHVGIKVLRTRDEVLQHCVVRLGKEGVAIYHGVGAMIDDERRPCLSFNTEISIEVANALQPQFGTNPPPGSLVQFDGTELAIVAQEKESIRLFRISDGVEIPTKLSNGLPYFPRWFFMRRWPQVNETVVRETSRVIGTWPSRQDEDGQLSDPNIQF